MPESTNNIRFRDGYETTIEISHLTESDSTIRKVILRDAFPIGYASQQLNWGDDGFQRLTVQFAYHDFFQTVGT